MFGRFLSALFSFGQWLAKSIMAKFYLFFGLWFVTTEFMAVLTNYLPTATGLNSAFSMQSSGVWYFWNLFNLGYGISACLAAFVTRFIIRRLPVIG